MSTELKSLSYAELLNLCKDRNIKLSDRYSKTQLIDLLSGKEIVKKYKCDFDGCSYSSNKIYNLKIHNMVHTGEKPHKCDFPDCDYAFILKSHLVYHKRKHTGERPHKCDFPDCDYAAAKNNDLRTHKRTHTGERPYKCDFKDCDSAFTQSVGLINHKRIHTGERPYKCDFKDCDSAFTQSVGLITHKRTHTGERPYKCDYKDCNSAFSKNEHLVIHKRRHIGEKPYICDFSDCNYAATTSNGLTIHKRRHTGEKPYKCDFDNCIYSSVSSGNLTSHKKSMHTEEGQRRQKKSEHFTFSYLQKHIDIKREHRIDFSCNGGTFCRLDGLSLHKNKKGQAFIIAHENDENQHSGYIISCDTRRMMEVKTALIQEGNDMPLIFIRYNPDSFRIDGELQKIKKKDRLNRYIELVKELEKKEEDMIPLTIYYLYYDVNGDNLEIFYDPEYPEDLKGNIKIVY